MGGLKCNGEEGATGHSMSGDEEALRGTLFVSTSTGGTDAAAPGIGDAKFTATWTSGVPCEWRAFLVGCRSKLRECGGAYIVA
jgi:hypothetical protein